VKIIEEFEKPQKATGASNSATFLSIHISKHLFKGSWWIGVGTLPCVRPAVSDRGYQETSARKVTSLSLFIARWRPRRFIQ